MDNRNTIPDNLRSDVVRNLIENKNVLAQKGALYVGTGNSQEFDGTSCAETVAITPPSQVDCVLVSDNSPLADGGLKWKTIKQAVQDARNNGQSITVDDANNAVSSRNVSTTINGVALNEIFEDNKKTVKESTLAQSVADGSITKSAFNKPKELVSHSIYIRGLSDASTAITIICVDNNPTYGNNFTKFCEKYNRVSFADIGVNNGSFLNVSGYAERESKTKVIQDETGAEQTLYFEVCKPIILLSNVVGGGIAYSYRMQFKTIYYEDRINANATAEFSLYIRNGSDGTKAYKTIEPESGEVTFVMRDLAYSVTGIENI